MTPLITAELGRDAVAARLQKRRLGTKERDALELLTAASPSCPEPLLLAHGLKTEMLSGLVRNGLAIAQTESVSAGGRPVEVIRLKITDAGRQALQDDDDLIAACGRPADAGHHVSKLASQQRGTLRADHARKQCARRDGSVSARPQRHA